MEKKLILEALKKIKESSKKRNFKQSVDLIFNFKGLNMKKPEHQLDLFVQLHKNKDKKSNVCALVGPELLEQAKKVCEKAINVDEFDVYAKDKKKCKKLAREFDFFIGQANTMPKIAAAFGRFLGPLGKMPSPKAGCIVPPNANLEPLYNKLQKTIKVSVKKDPIFQCSVGYEDKNEDELIDNIETVYNYIESHLPSEKRNIASVYMKITMGPAFKIMKEGKKKESNEEVAEEEPKKEEKAKGNKTKKESKKEEKAEGKKEKVKEKTSEPSDSEADKAK